MSILRKLFKKKEACVNTFYHKWGMPDIDVTNIPHAKGYSCPQYGWTPTVEEYRSWFRKYPICCNEVLYSNMDGTTHDWVEIHKCPYCKKKFWYINGCF